MSKSLEMFETSLLPSTMKDTYKQPTIEREREIDECGTGRKRRKRFLTINKHCRTTLQYIFVWMLLMISALETLSILINKIDGIDIPTLSNIFTHAIRDMDIPNATSNAIRNTFTLDIFNKYTNISLTPHDIG